MDNVEIFIELAAAGKIHGITDDEQKIADSGMAVQVTFHIHNRGDPLMI
jgi:hypothetical protein